jgi:hypothetical protein
MFPISVVEKVMSISLVAKLNLYLDLNLSCDLGDSTIYGDRWSNASGTLQLRRSRLLPNNICCLTHTNDTFISDLLWEINKERKARKASLLRTTDQLMMKAQRHANKMAAERKIK